MNHHITRFHTHYRLFGDARTANAFSLRRGEADRDAIFDELESLLDQRLAGDPAVYVVRKVRSRVTLRTVDDRWQHGPMAQGLADSIVSVLGDSESENVVRFSDQADFVTRFIIELLAGRAWDLWYFGAFRYLQGPDTSDVLKQVLLEHSEFLPQILALLQARESLESVCDTLGENATAQIWANGLGGAVVLDAAEVRPLVAAALQLAARLKLISHSPPDTDRIARELVSSSTIHCDWTSEKALAQGVSEIVRFLSDSGYLNPVDVAETEIRTCCRPLDWLDTETLTQNLCQLLNVKSAMPEKAKSQVARPELRPIFKAAVQLCREVFRWAPSRPSEANMMSAWFNSDPPECDWSDPASLADGVLDAVAFLIADGYVTVGSAEDDLDTRLRATTAKLDWLDANRLKRGVARLPARTAGSLPARETSSSGDIRTIRSPILRKLVQDLRTVVDRVRVHLDFTNRDSRKNAVRIFAALVEKFPEYGGQEMAAAAIERVLTAWALQSDPDPVQSRSTTLRGQSIARQAALRERRKAAMDRLCPDERLILQSLSTVAIDETPDAQKFETHVGWILLLRAVQDLRLSHLVKSTGFPASDTDEGLSALLVSTALRWAAIDPREDGQIDAGICRLAGFERSVRLSELQELLRCPGSKTDADFQVALTDALLRHRLLDADTLHLFSVDEYSGRACLIAGDPQRAVWAFGGVHDQHRGISEIVNDRLQDFESSLGWTPNVVADPALIERLRKHGGNAERNDRFICSTSDDELAASHTAGRVKLHSSWDALGFGGGEPSAGDLTVFLTAAALLRAWARWLRQFAGSSDAYLLKELIRRRGTVTFAPDSVTVQVPRRPLDVVIEMAGYLEPLDHLSWLDGRRLVFQVTE